MTNEQLKVITEARLQGVTVLMEAQDWFLAAYTMAMALECALKAVICRTLHLYSYPQDRKQAAIINFFWTHEFEQLLILSGLYDEFSPASKISEVVQNWGDFTKQFPGNWSAIKYDYEKQQQFDQERVKRLHINLTDPIFGVMTKIKEKW
ncbi:MAG: hypothetical protein KGI50_01560 [Patescibacteria group bacterium]|nr:hypothetical protein [Patescibacteria group bacterium]MDE2437970.1 hypothetical protein [Patescibacteria group bacterium]